MRGDKVFTQIYSLTIYPLTKGATVFTQYITRLFTLLDSHDILSHRFPDHSPFLADIPYPFTIIQ